MERKLVVIHIENPTKCYSVSKFYFIFIRNSKCFGRHTALHQEHKLRQQPLVLHAWKVVGRVAAGRCQAKPDSVQQLHVQKHSTHSKPEAAGAVLGS